MLGEVYAEIALRWEFIKEDKKKKREEELDQESDQEKKIFFSFFLVEFPFSFLFS